MSKIGLRSFMPEKPEESSENTELSVTSSDSDSQPVVVSPEAGSTAEDQPSVSPSDKPDEPEVAANAVDEEKKTMEQYLQARIVSGAPKCDTNDPNTNISWIPSFVKSLAGTLSSNEPEGSEKDSTNVDSDDESSRPDSVASIESSNLETCDDLSLPPLQPPVTRSAMQFHPIFPQSIEIPAPLNQWHLYNQQKSFNAQPGPPPPLRCSEPPDIPNIQAVKKTKRRKSSAPVKGKTPKKKGSKDMKKDSHHDDVPIKAPEVRDLPTTAAPRTNFNQAPQNAGPSCQPNYCPPCAQAPNLPPCPPTMTIPSCSQPLSACIPPASAMPPGAQPSSGCAASVSDPCNPCISGGYRMNNFNGGSCPDLYPPQTDICRPSNAYPQQQQCCPQQNVAPVELCEKSVCYCEKCENPDPNVPPQYNMQQWTCKFLRPVENAPGGGGGYFPPTGRGGQNYDSGFQMPQGGHPGNGGHHMGPGMSSAGMSAMNFATMGTGGMGMNGNGMNGSYGGGNLGPSGSMGYNPMCNPMCNPNYGSQPQYQQPVGGRACPPPGGFGTGCPPPGNPPPPPRCPVPCAPRCPPRTCYQKTFTDWAENDPRDALMSRITMYPPIQQQRSFDATTPTLRNMIANPQFQAVGFNPNAHTNMVTYHPEMHQAQAVPGAISVQPPRFDENIIPQSPRYSNVNVIRTPRLNTQFKRPRSVYAAKEPELVPASIDIVEPDLLNTRSSQLRYHYSQQRRSDTPRVAPSKKTEIYNGEIDWKSEPKLQSSETVASKLRRQHNRNKLKQISEG